LIQFELLEEQKARLEANRLVIQPLATNSGEANQVVPSLQNRFTQAMLHNPDSQAQVSEFLRSMLQTILDAEQPEEVYFIGARPMLSFKSNVTLLNFDCDRIRLFCAIVDRYYSKANHLFGNQNSVTEYSQLVTEVFERYMADNSMDVAQLEEHVLR